MNERIPAYEGREPYIFVSYAHKNSDSVIPVIESLFADKYRVWYDEGIAPGSEWPKNIEDHLREAAAVLVFVSDESLASPNCENEVANSKPNERSVYQFSIDGKLHEKLDACERVSSYDDLKLHLNDILIGDGKTGYDRNFGKAKRGNYWTSLIVLAIMLVVALAAGLYELNAGWFDSMLPGLNQLETVDEASEEIVVTGNNILTNAITKLTNDELLEEIEFESDETRDALYRAIGFYDWGDDRNITYQDLVNNDAKELWLEDANDELLSLMQYFPNLQVLSIRSGQVKSLKNLLTCAKLKTVKLWEEVIPLEIPQPRSFVVEYAR